MKCISSLYACVLMVDILPRANAFGGPRFVLSRPQRGHHEGRGTRQHVPPQYPIQTAGDRRLTTIHSSNNDDQGELQRKQQQQQQRRPKPTVDVHPHQLVLREFAMPLQADPALYERRVRAECLREGGETATVVRWHISRADTEAGQARVEAVFLAANLQGTKTSPAQTP